MACIASAVLASLTLLPPQPLAAQSVDTFSKIPLQVNVDDHVVATDTAGHTTTGRMLRMSGDALLIATAAGPRTLSRADLTAMAIRTRHTRTGLLLGAAPGAVAGAVAACTAADRSECGDGTLMAGASGAGIGALMGALLTTRRVIFQTSERSPSSDAVLSAAVSDLLRDVNTGDLVRVKRRSGQTVVGRLRDASDNDLIIASNGADVHVDAESVQSLDVRRYQAARGALVGAGAFALVALAAPACRENGRCSPIVAAAFGSGAGAAIGALIPRMVSIVPRRSASTAWSPVLWKDRAGVNATLRW